jgi:hypothetical protein
VSVCVCLYQKLSVCTLHEPSLAAVATDEASPWHSTEPAERRPLPPSSPGRLLVIPLLNPRQADLVAEGDADGPKVRCHRAETDLVAADASRE